MKSVRLFFVLIVFFCLVFATCKSAPANTPDWLNDVPPEGALWGIGSDVSMVTAESRARRDIARKLSAMIDAMATDFAAEGQSQNNDATRSVINVDVSGARVIRHWQAPDGIWWYKVELTKADIDSLVGARYNPGQALEMLENQFAGNE